MYTTVEGDNLVLNREGDKMFKTVTWRPGTSSPSHQMSAAFNLGLSELIRWVDGDLNMGSRMQSEKHGDSL